MSEYTASFPPYGVPQEIINGLAATGAMVALQEGLSLDGPGPQTDRKTIDIDEGIRVTHCGNPLTEIGISQTGHGGETVMEIARNVDGNVTIILGANPIVGSKWPKNPKDSATIFRYARGLVDRCADILEGRFRKNGNSPKPDHGGSSAA